MELTRVYRAKTKRDFDKVQEFLEAQPEDSFPYICHHNPVLKGMPVDELIEHWGDKLGIGVVENDNREIRGVAFQIFGDYYLGDEKIPTSKQLGTIIHYKDVEDMNFEYIKELIDWGLRYLKRMGFRFFHSSCPSDLFDLVYGDIPIKAFFDLTEAETFLGKVKRFIIDLEKL